MRDPQATAVSLIRRQLMRWLSVSALLWIATAVAVTLAVEAGWVWAPALWIVAVASFLAISWLIARRTLRAVDALDNDRVVIRDAYDRTRAEVMRDGLTGLGSHRAFQEEIDIDVAASRRDDLAFSLLIIDVDDLKKTNDDRGHAAGDELLRATARIISSNLRRGDRAFRIGGDEFAVIVRDCAPADSVDVAWRILSAALSGGSGTLGVAPFSLTIGVSGMPALARDRRQLLHQAEAALFWGKRHGRTDVQLFDSSRHGMADDWRPLEELAAAVTRVADERLLVPVYQPIYSLRTGQVMGYEGLVRPTPDSGFANASALFVAAESTDRTVELDIASLDAVLAGATSLDASCYLSVNLSPRSLESDAFKPHEVLALARKRDIDASRIVVELTERESIEDFDRVRSALAMLRRHGVRIAADDVGAGNAGLRLLRELEFDTIKVDLSLVQAGAHEDPSGAVLKALRELARQRHQVILAEGVETPDQLLAVVELGFDAAQGYLLRRPGPHFDAERLDLARLAFPPDPLPDPAPAAVSTPG